MSSPVRGEVYWVNLDPTIGSEIKKTRPALIVSNNIANQYSNIVIVAPITSSIKKIYPFDVKVNIGSKEGKALLSQIRSIDKKRLSKKITSLEVSVLKEIDKALKIVLELD